MSEENKALARRFYEELVNAQNLDAAEQFVAPDFIEHLPMPPGTPPGLEGFKVFMGAYFQAFPDLRLNVEWMVAEGDMVVTHLTVRGTHKGELMGIPPTGKEVTVTLTDANRISGGKFVEHWANFDQFGLMQQIGAIPTKGGESRQEVMS